MPKFYLKDWHGKKQEFTDDKIFVRGEDGELIQFTQGDGDIPAVVQPLEVTESGTYTAPDGVDGYSPVTVNIPAAETTVQPDFADGDMEVLPGDDEFLSKVTIQKPETLIPENIAEGVNIAGVIGALAAGAEVKCATGKFDCTTSAVTVTHNLGVVPDFVAICATYIASANVSSGERFAEMRFSKALAEKLTPYRTMTSISMNSSTKLGTFATTSMYVDDSATDTTFTFSGLSPNYDGYMWVAIGGLT